MKEAVQILNYFFLVLNFSLLLYCLKHVVVLYMNFFVCHNFRSNEFSSIKCFYIDFNVINCHIQLEKWIFKSHGSFYSNVEFYLQLRIWFLVIYLKSFVRYPIFRNSICFNFLTSSKYRYFKYRRYILSLNNIVA